jgi:hypothetical protein
METLLSLVRLIVAASLKAFKIIASLMLQMLNLLARWLRSGKSLTPNGYILRRSMSGQEQLDHRYVAETVLGRRLETWEVVHHINGRRSDNRPQNLCVMNNRKHELYHEWYDWVRENYKKHPRRVTQLRKLRDDFNGTLLGDY